MVCRRHIFGHFAVFGGSIFERSIYRSKRLQRLRRGNNISGDTTTSCALFLAGTLLDIWIELSFQPRSGGSVRHIGGGGGDSAWFLASALFDIWIQLPFESWSG